MPNLMLSAQLSGTSGDRSKPRMNAANLRTQIYAKQELSTRGMDAIVFSPEMRCGVNALRPLIMAALTLRLFQVPIPSA